ncbi:MAG: hypothetical protein A2840_01255 [Candidatus Buchananbacteria bacterium RIFCSPHIGHO2_01_FULL_47_11b]|uniref:Cell division protein FtsL n=1 Tax=Candidatus Buchananbacteria bacterium RIFCSPHIGHO2_01_FULL_47_11b TaxID=1797537 RepID=A0A1G1Y5L1_9BACT|nr:MAG: hypothetical protein A2840_01255 [Candidatus Buchananbacteria bacterium RIFCSPHIGHO2_01_FULL_47_11b]
MASFKTRSARPQLPANQGAVPVVNLTLIGFVVVAVAVYLFQVNSLATKGYEIRELESQIKEVRQQNQQLQLAAAELESLESIKNKVAELNMVAVGKADFINAAPMVVAAAR